jgi:hypothetical protein
MYLHEHLSSCSIAKRCVAVSNYVIILPSLMDRVAYKLALAVICDW